MTNVEDDLAARMKTSAAFFKRKKAEYERARGDLNSLIFDADEQGSGPSEIARVTGFTREWVAKLIAAEKKRRGIED
jgi:hypothetical protein